MHAVCRGLADPVMAGSVCRAGAEGGRGFPTAIWESQPLEGRTLRWKTVGWTGEYTVGDTREGFVEDGDLSHSLQEKKGRSGEGGRLSLPSYGTSEERAGGLSMEGEEN